MPLKFHFKYFIAASVLFITEVCIALYAHDKIIRPFVGDVLVVILMYCFIRSFFNYRVLPTAVAVLMFSYALETLQYFHIVKILGLQNYELARTVIGTSFEWTDILAYTIGIGLVILFERKNLINDESKK